MSEQAPLRALLVGIDRYPEPPPGGFAYHSLYGAVSDVARVEEYLCGTLGVPAGNVTRHLAPHQGGDPAKWPTHANLVAALGELERSCLPGEQALVYYSGHGGRAPTRLPLIKGAHGLDEVLAPADVGDPAVPYLRDVEIAVWLARMAARGVFVTLILDCCHSGGAVRRDRRVRGHEGVDRTQRPEDGLLAGREEIAALWRRAPADRAGDRLDVVPVRAQAPTGYALIAACRPQERAVEAEIAGDWRGVMTHHLLAALRRADEPGLTYRRLHAMVTARLHSAGYAGQTPVVDGESDRLLFGRERLPARRGVEVLEVEGWPGERVRLATGSLHGACRGGRYALVAPGAGGAVAERLAEAEIIEVGQTSSWARRETATPGARAVRSGDAAILVDPGPLARRRTVGWGGESGAGVEHRIAWLAALLDEHGDGLLTAAEPGAAGDLEVVETSGLLEIRDAGGNPIPEIGPPLALLGPATPRELARRLCHLARWWNVRALENPDATSPLAGALRLRVERLGDPAPAGRSTAVPVGGGLRLVLENAGAVTLNAAVLDLQPDWGIQQIVPYRDAAPWIALEPGCPLEVELTADLPDGLDQGADVLKAVAAVGPFELATLELPAIGTPPGAVRSARRIGLAHEALRCGATAPESWTTAEVEVRVAREPGRADAPRTDHTTRGENDGESRPPPLNRKESAMSKTKNGATSLGRLLTTVGVTGTATAVLVLYALDFHVLLQAWAAELQAIFPGLSVAPRVLAQAELLVMALSLLAGGTLLMAAGLGILIGMRVVRALEPERPESSQAVSEPAAART